MSVSEPAPGDLQWFVDHMVAHERRIDYLVGELEYRPPTEDETRELLAELQRLRAARYLRPPGPDKFRDGSFR